MNAREIRLKRQGLSVEDGVPLLIRLICSTMADMCSGSSGSFADDNLMDRPGEIRSPFPGKLSFKINKAKRDFSRKGEMKGLEKDK